MAKGSNNALKEDKTVARGGISFSKNINDSKLASTARDGNETNLGKTADTNENNSKLSLLNIKNVGENGSVCADCDKAPEDNLSSAKPEKSPNVKDTKDDSGTSLLNEQSTKGKASIKDCAGEKSSKQGNTENLNGNSKNLGSVGLALGAGTSSAAIGTAGALISRSFRKKLKPELKPEPLLDPIYDTNKDPKDISPEKSQKINNLLRPILWVVGSVLTYIILHYLAKSLLFYGVWFKSNEDKNRVYKDIEELKIDGHPETRALIAYKTASKEEESNEKEDKSKRDTIVLSFCGNYTDGRDAINRIRAGTRKQRVHFKEDGVYEECRNDDCNCEKDPHYLYLGGELPYTTASIIPRGFYSNQNIFKKIKDISEQALYEDAEALYDYVTDKLGYKNVIINGFCQGGPIAAHVVKYAEKKAKKGGEKSKVIGLVLNGPMDGIYSSQSKAVRYNILINNIFGRIFGSAIGFVAKLLFPFTSLDTYESLKSVEDKNLPILCLSGGNRDFLSFNKTNIDKKLREDGFSNVTTVIDKNTDHNIIFEEDFVELKPQIENLKSIKGKEVSPKLLNNAKKTMVPNTKRIERKIKDFILIDAKGKSVDFANKKKAKKTVKLGLDEISDENEMNNNNNNNNVKGNLDEQNIENLNMNFENIQGTNQPVP